MNKFNLERALSGEKVITRDGIEVDQFIRFDCEDGDCLRGVVNGSIESFYPCGSYHSGDEVDVYDLFMAPKKLSGFVNVYSREEGNVFTSLHDSKDSSDDSKKALNGFVRIACIDLSQFDEGHGL